MGALRSLTARSLLALLVAAGCSTQSNTLPDGCPEDSNGPCSGDVQCDYDIQCCASGCGPTTSCVCSNGALSCVALDTCFGEPRDPPRPPSDLCGQPPGSHPAPDGGSKPAECASDDDCVTYCADVLTTLPPGVVGCCAAGKCYGCVQGNADAGPGDGGPGDAGPSSADSSPDAG